MFPKLSDLPKTVAFNAVVGGIYGLLFTNQPKIAACAFAVTALADAILFAIVNPLCHGDGSVKSFKVLTITHSLVAIASIVAYRRLNLIATLGTAVYAAFELVVLIGRISVLQELEAQNGLIS